MDNLVMSATSGINQSFGSLSETGRIANEKSRLAPSYVGIGVVSKSDVSECTFEESLVKPHQRILATRRIIAGLAYYAYFLLALQCTLNLVNTTITTPPSQTIISAVTLLAVVVFSATEIYADTSTNYMSMTSIMSEMMARLFSRGYNAIGLFDNSWGEIRHRHLSESFRSSLADDRDALVYLYATDKSQDSYMKMTYAITSPKAVSMWSILFPNLCAGFSTDFDGGVVQSLHTVSLGTSYTPISSVDFVIKKDNLVTGVVKTVWRSLTGSIVRSRISLLEMTANSVKDTNGHLKVSKNVIHVSCTRAHNVTDAGEINFQSSDLNVSFNYDRMLGTLHMDKVSAPENGEFESTAG